jgi:hypothetical protein
MLEGILVLKIGMSGEEEKDIDEQLKLWELKTNPATVGAILADGRAVMVERLKRYSRPVWIVRKAIVPILNKHGVTGWHRMPYYDLVQTLWKWLKKYPEKLWGKYIGAIVGFYMTIFELDEKIVDEIVDVAVKTIREVLKEYNKAKEEV